MWQNSRCSILFHLQVPGGKWHTVIVSPVSAASLAEFDLPQPAAVAVGAAAVGGDQQLRSRSGRPAAHLLPPAADGLDRERGGVVVDRRR